MPTFTLIGSPVTVGAGGASSIDFSSIPTTYTDLVLFISLRSSNSADYISLKFNNSTASFTGRTMNGNGSTTGSENRTDNFVTGVMSPSTYTASTFSNGVFYIPNYTSSSNKSYLLDVVPENNATATEMRLSTGLWSNTAAINRITFDHPTAGTFVQHSTAHLYGVSNV